MYLAQFHAADGRWLQGCAHLPYVVNSSQDAWAGLLRTITALLVAQAELRLSYRALITPHAIRRIIILSVASQNEQRLRRVLGAFTRLETLCDGSAELMFQREDYDRSLQDFGRLRAAIFPPDDRVGDAWIANDFRVGPLLSQLAREACHLSRSFTYQANFEPIGDRIGPWRAAALNLVHLESVAGAPHALLEGQKRLIEKLRFTATFLIEEILGADSQEDEEWLIKSLERRFAERFSAWQLQPPPYSFDSDGCDIALLTARHRAAFEKLSAAETVSSAVESREVEDILAWNPPDNFQLAPAHERLGPAPDDLMEPAEFGRHRRHLVPKPYGGTEDFLFVSYKRDDIPRVAPILDKLIRWGQRVWYDKDIPGGAEWDAFIEDRIASCKLLVLFMTPAALNSRYVRREVKFADSMGKPLLTLALENGEIPHGLKMLLGQYQTVNAAAPDFDAQLKRALQYLGA